MSSSVCTQCGALHERSGAVSQDLTWGRDPRLICSECGAEFGGANLAEVPTEPTRVEGEPSSGVAVAAEPAAEPVDSAEVANTDAANAEAAEAPRAETESLETLSLEADANDDPPTLRAPSVAVAIEEPDRDSVIPVESRDFVDEEAPRQRRLPKAPARPQGPKTDTEWLDELPMSVGTPTLAALVQRANPESDRPEAPSIPPDLLAERAFDLATNDWDARLMPLLRQPTTDAPVVNPSAAPQTRKPSRRSVTVVILAVAGAAFAAGLSVKSSAPATGASAPPLPRAAEPTANIQAAKPALAPPEFAIEPATPEQNPASLPLAEGAPKDPPSSAAAAPEPAQAAPKVVPPASRAPTAEAAASPAPAAEAPAAEAPTSPAPDAAFDAHAAEAAIGAAASRAAACKQAGDPGGVAVVTVTFSPSGRATTANVAGAPFAGTKAGGCIAATLRAARVPAFSGEFVTVKKSVKIY